MDQCTNHVVIYPNCSKFTAPCDQCQTCCAHQIFGHEICKENVYCYIKKLCKKVMKEIYLDERAEKYSVFNGGSWNSENRRSRDYQRSPERSPRRFSESTAISARGKRVNSEENVSARRRKKSKNLKEDEEDGHQKKNKKKGKYSENDRKGKNVEESSKKGNRKKDEEEIGSGKKAKRNSRKKDVDDEDLGKKQNKSGKPKEDDVGSKPRKGGKAKEDEIESKQKKGRNSQLNYGNDGSSSNPKKGRKNDESDLNTKKTQSKEKEELRRKSKSEDRPQKNKVKETTADKQAISSNPKGKPRNSALAAEFAKGNTSPVNTGAIFSVQSAKGKVAQKGGQKIVQPGGEILFRYNSKDKARRSNQPGTSKHRSTSQGTQRSSNSKGAKSSRDILPSDTLRTVMELKDYLRGCKNQNEPSYNPCQPCASSFLSYNNKCGDYFPCRF